MAKQLNTQQFALKILSKMDELQRRKDYPNVRYVTGTKYTEKNANDIEKAIERFARIAGFHAERTKTQGRKMGAVYKDTPNGRLTVSKEKFVTSTSRKGSSDLKLLIDGKLITAEVKFGKDRQSPDQKKYQADIERNGGLYVIFKTFEDFLIWYVKEYGRPQVMQQAIEELKRK